MIEVEVKIPIENIEKIKKKLLETGFIYQKTVVETDTYFISDHYDMRKKDKALRIRKTENLDTGEVKAQLNCKGPKLDQVSMTRKETEIDIYEPEKMDMEGIGMYEGYTHMANIFLTGGSEELQQNIWEILEQEPECDGGVTKLVQNDLTVRIFGQRAQKLQEVAEKMKAAFL